MLETLFKIVVVGEGGAGKTAIIRRYVTRKWSEHKMTIGVDFALKQLKWSRSEAVKLQLWDISGQERFGHLTRVYYKDAAAAVVVFDVTCQRSFDLVRVWKKDLDKKLFLHSGSPVPAILLGNKSDLEKQRKVSEEEATALAQELGFEGYFTTSALANRGIDAAFASLVQSLLSEPSQLEHASSVGAGRRDTIRIEQAIDAMDRPHNKPQCCA